MADGGLTSYPLGTRPLGQVGESAPGRISRVGTRLFRDGSPIRLSGANIYWLGLDDNQTPSSGVYPSKGQITAALASVRDRGGNAVRAHTIGMSAGLPMSFETEPGTFVDANLDAADYAIYQAGLQGITLIVPLVDQHNYYHGGKGVFVKWAYDQNPSGITPLPYPGNLFNAGPGKDSVEERQFYNNDTPGLRIRAYFTDYVTNLMNHVNSYTGLAWKNDPTIGVWETGNELFDSTPEWQDYCAQLIKSLAPAALVADGSAATGLTVASAKGIGSTAIDIVGSHYYMQNADYSAKIGFTATPSQYGSSTSALQQIAADITAAMGAGKAFLIGEYPWTRADVTAFYAAVDADPRISGDLMWSVIADALTHGDANPAGDDYALHSAPLAGFEQQTAPRLAQHQIAVTGLAARNSADQTRNLLPTNVARASDTTWVTGGGGTFSTDSTVSMEGGSSLKVTPNVNDYPYWRQTDSSIAAGAEIVPGQQYTAYAYVRTTSGTFGFHTRALWASAVGSIGSTLDGSYTSVTVAGSWTVVKVTGIAPAGAVRMGIQVQADNQMTTGDVFNVDQYGVNFGDVAGPWAIPPAPAVVGSVAGTLPKLTGAVSGTVLVPATLSGTTPPTTGSIVGTLTNPATVSGSVPALVGAVSGTVVQAATLTGSTPVTMGSLPGAVLNQGVLSGSPPLTTGSLPGTVIQTATLSGATSRVTGTLPASIVQSGALTGSTPAVVGSIPGTVVQSATLAGFTPSTVGALSGTVVQAASIAGSTPPTIGAISGTVFTPGTVSGSTPMTTGYIPGGGANLGSISGSTPPLQGSLPGVQVIPATVTGTTPRTSGSVPGVVVQNATVTGPTPTLTGTIPGSVVNNATTTGTVPTATGSIPGTVATPGSVSGTVPLLVGSIAEAGKLPGTLDGTLPAVVGSIPGTVTLPAVLGGTTPALRGVIPGTVLTPATLAASTPNVAGSIAGIVRAPGQVSGTTPPLAGALAGTLSAQGTLDGRVPLVVGVISAVPPADFTITVGRIVGSPLRAGRIQGSPFRAGPIRG